MEWGRGEDPQLFLYALSKNKFLASSFASTAFDLTSRIITGGVVIYHLNQHFFTGLRYYQESMNGSGELESHHSGLRTQDYGLPFHLSFKKLPCFQVNIDIMRIIVFASDNFK